MKKLALALAAGFLFAAPAFVAPASAATMTDAVDTIPLTAGAQLAQVHVHVDRPRMRRHMHRRDRVCTTRVSYRNGRKVVVRRCR